MADDGSEERIADHFLEAVRKDARDEKARLEGDEEKAETVTRAAEEQAAREQQIEAAFNQEVDRLAAEEPPSPSVPPSRRTSPSGSRA